jgi:hypothetical protein
MAVNTIIRCSGCGKPLDLEGKTAQKVVRIMNGKLKNGLYVEGKEWGVLHEACFNRSIDSPDAVLDEVRRQAREPRSAA